MRLDSIHKTVNGKTYTSHLIREAYRDNGRTRHRTIANLSGRSGEEMAAIRLALKHSCRVKSTVTGAGVATSILA